MMDQFELLTLEIAQETFYVHDGSTEIVYIGKNKARSFMSMMDQFKLLILEIAQQTFSAHDGSTEIVYIGKNKKFYADTQKDFFCPRTGIWIWKCQDNLFGQIQ